MEPGKIDRTCHAARKRAQRKEQQVRSALDDHKHNVLTFSSSLSLSPRTTPKKSYKKVHVERAFDPKRYNTRFIALKLAYLGKRYNGFEHTIGNLTPLPTIEEELWKALNKAKLIIPKEVDHLQPGEVNWEGTDYSKSGRTDKGVSAFGQVIGIRVRSNRPLVRATVDGSTGGQKSVTHKDEVGKKEVNGDGLTTFLRDGAIEVASAPLGPSRSSLRDEEPEVLNPEDPYYEEALKFDPIADELPYATILNKLLPPDIRILAWCPFPPLGFDARFSCRERRYRYFFTQPAFSPVPHNLDSGTGATQVKDGWLDIDAMKEAARMYEGIHDFRNFCKVDAGKQISSFERRIFYSDVEEVTDQSAAFRYVDGADFLPAGLKDGNPKVYTFTLHGSAFLWHQVRHMVAILFLVGQGLEKPSIVAELLNIKKNPRKPQYEMATDTPLVLWDCIFPREDDPERKDILQWLYVGDGPRDVDAKYGPGGLMNSLWCSWRERKIDEMLVGSLMGLVADQGAKPKDLKEEGKSRKSQKVFDGGNTPRLQGVYVPVMKKPLLESPDVINEKYAVRKGFENSADMKVQGFRRLNKPAEAKGNYD
jgi:tRNA pseudouridine38/39 synthase